MTLEALKTQLESAGLPVAYHAWPEGEAPAPPYLCFLEAYSNNFHADGVVYFEQYRVQVELYTAQKDPAAEAQVEAALAAIPWEKTATYIESQQCWQILYEIEV